MSISLATGSCPFFRELRHFCGIFPGKQRAAQFCGAKPCGLQEPAWGLVQDLVVRRLRHLSFLRRKSRPIIRAMASWLLAK